MLSHFIINGFALGMLADGLFLFLLALKGEICMHCVIIFCQFSRIIFMIIIFTYSFVYFYILGPPHPFFRDVWANLASCMVVSVVPSQTGRNQEFAH